jgi:hypothetical protein
MRAFAFQISAIPLPRTPIAGIYALQSLALRKPDARGFPLFARQSSTSAAASVHYVHKLPIDWHQHFGDARPWY